MSSLHERKYVAMVSLKFGCKQWFIEKGKSYNSHTFEFAKVVALNGSNIWFRNDDGEKIQLSGVKGSEWDYRGLFKVMKGK